MKFFSFMGAFAIIYFVAFGFNFIYIPVTHYYQCNNAQIAPPLPGAVIDYESELELAITRCQERVKSSLSNPFFLGLVAQKSIDLAIWAFILLMVWKRRKKYNLAQGEYPFLRSLIPSISSILLTVIVLGISWYFAMLQFGLYYSSTKLPVLVGLIFSVVVKIIFAPQILLGIGIMSKIGMTIQVVWAYLLVCFIKYVWNLKRTNVNSVDVPQ